MEEDTLVKIDMEIKKINTMACVLIPIFILFIITSPILFTRSWTGIDFTQTGGIGSTIGGITSPIIGILSAVLVFLSFKAQIKANRHQIEAIQIERDNRKIENEVAFVYKRLEDIKGTNRSKEFAISLPTINGMLDDIINIVKSYNKEPKGEFLENIEKAENDKLNPLLLLMNQISIFEVIYDIIEAINSKLSQNQVFYITTSLRYEYMFYIDKFTTIYIPKIERIEQSNLLNNRSVLPILKNYCIKISNKIDLNNGV